MLLSRFVYTKISSANVLYWRSLGYDVRGGGRGGISNGTRIKVKVGELKPNSNVNVACRCDNCGRKYIQRFSRDKNVCYPCRKSEEMKGNSYGGALKGKKNPKMTGELHPNWNPDKPAFIRYGTQVRWLSELAYRAHTETINPEGHPRTLCGVEGGYQLDHKTSIKKAYDLGWTPEQCADIRNLQLLPWADNRAKWK